MYTEEKPESDDGMGMFDMSSSIFETLFSLECANDPHSVYPGLLNECPVGRVGNGMGGHSVVLTALVIRVCSKVRSGVRSN